MGHVLGLGHSDEGIMTPGSSDPNRKGKTPNKKIEKIIKSASKGEPNKPKGVDAGRGTLKYIHDKVQEWQKISPIPRICNY